MQFQRISRETQERRVQPMALSSSSLGDSILDGVPVRRPSYSTNWILESSIHQTVKLSNDVENTRNFCGQQINMARDELREKSWALHIESNGRLILSEIIGKKINQTIAFDSSVSRSHLHVDKFSGKTFITCIKKDSGQVASMYFNGAKLDTEASDPDFPFFATDQAPIGHVPAGPFTYGMLTYKDRSAGVVYIRKYSGRRFSSERPLFAGKTIGGASISVVGTQVICYVFSVNGDAITPMFAISSDGGDSFSEFENIELEYDGSYTVHPNSGAPTVDFSGVSHFPVLVGNATETVLVDVIVPDKIAVEAIKIPGQMDLSTRGSLDKFPKSSACMREIMFDESHAPKTLDYRLGDGNTDGVGIIATLALKGKLHSSNSQSGGHSYPVKGQLNHEMLEVAVYSTTECYSRGENPNTVSMDYMFLECIEASDPISGELHLETWDMPLPEPALRAKQVNKDTVEVSIEKDGNFIPGRTVFTIDDPTLAVVDIRWEHVRKVRIKVARKTPRSMLRGKRLTFEAKSIFYHHKASAVVE